MIVAHCRADLFTLARIALSGDSVRMREATCSDVDGSRCDRQLGLGMVRQSRVRDNLACPPRRPRHCERRVNTGPGAPVENVTRPAWRWECPAGCLDHCPIMRSGEEECVIGVEQWVEVRRMHRVERLSIREIQRRRV